ncbi:MULTISPECIES: class I SAM-dependent methyltransferase [Cohnella]|uniref:class I SAM-dependent methyltransferase n=1 Tax=Cohnella TaxID=329857 RepID=UPI0009BA5B9B|nr:MULTISPECIES: class I SAM-dependent methyltransferase [Cohnella]MBN2979904.1 class I SAM-dependent methyltransferase [Cohnella algarum]
MSQRAPATKNEITYALFELDPAVYYEERYAYSNVVGIVEKEGPVAKNSLVYQKSSCLMEALGRCVAAAGTEEIKVLEVGCGSGTFGARVKRDFPNVRLYGVDMSSSCIEIAKQNGFDRAVAYDVVQGLPYADGEFDFIYTMDFFGHVEFRSKDRIISEMHRVTKPGGYGFHGIETGFIDYLNCDPKNPDDVVRKYVYMEGHIGVETLEDILDRFEPRFEVVQTFPFPIRPLLNIGNIMNSKFWGEEFCAAFAQVDTPATRAAADLVLGWFNKHLTGQLFEAFGSRLVRSRIPDTGNPALNRFIDTMLQGCGFSMTTLRKPQ